MSGAPGVPPAMAAAWVVALRSLGDLVGWQPLDGLAERVVSALRGEAGLDREDVRRLRDWPAAWAAVHPEVRAFYRRALAQAPSRSEASEAAVGRGVWSLLEGRPVPAATRGVLRRLHEDIELRAPMRALTGGCDG